MSTKSNWHKVKNFISSETVKSQTLGVEFVPTFGIIN